MNLPCPKTWVLNVCVVVLLISVSAQVLSGIAPGQASVDEFSPSAPSYVGIAKYYDNRRCVVTVSLDDFGFNSSIWQSALSMLNQKRIYHTVGIITNYANWGYAQYWINQGFTEAASHSRTHATIPYNGFDGNKSRGGYTWQIDGSKADIVGNLTLPKLWRNGNTQYVYAWIEPYGKCDANARQQINRSQYLIDRTVLPSIHVYGLANLDSSAGLFDQVGYTVEMDDSPWQGTTSVLSLNGYFDEAYRRGGIYHLTSHAELANWTKGSYTDEHTDFIADRNDVWYVPFGLLYLYRYVDVASLTRAKASPSQGVFDISVDDAAHKAYGVAYPITYVFNIPPNWTDGYIYYRYNESQPWRRMLKTSSNVLFNGITASRFDFSDHKAYVSVAFASGNDHVYVQIQPQKQPSPNGFADSFSESWRFGSNSPFVNGSLHMHHHVFSGSRQTAS